tara:strand:- start:182 stop:493 length:312 start_codon:yes stop_codon:yes gene_type:complete
MGFFGYIGKLLGYNRKVNDKAQNNASLESRIEELNLQNKSMRTQIDQLTASLNHLTIAHMQLSSDMGVIYSSLKAIAENADQDPFSFSMLGYGNDDDDGGLPN